MGSAAAARLTKPTHHRGFSLLELLVVIGIIVLLMGILLPVVGNVRKSARSTACLANLQQWGASFQMYLASNHGKTMSDAGDWMADRRWWEWLGAYNGNVRASLLCPEALQRRDDLPPFGGGHFINRGSAQAAWAMEAPNGDAVGSYGFNHWIYQPNTRRNPNPYFRYPLKDASVIPILGDCSQPYALPIGPDVVPTSLIDPNQIGIGAYCLDRHRMAVNIVFFDGHAEHVTLAGLWKLKWARNSRPTDVVLP